MYIYAMSMQLRLVCKKRIKVTINNNPSYSHISKCAYVHICRSARLPRIAVAHSIRSEANLLVVCNLQLLCVRVCIIHIFVLFISCVGIQASKQSEFLEKKLSFGNRLTRAYLAYQVELKSCVLAHKLIWQRRRRRRQLLETNFTRVW